MAQSPIVSCNSDAVNARTVFAGADGTMRSFDGDVADYSSFVLGKWEAPEVRKSQPAAKAPTPVDWRDPPNRAAISARCETRSPISL